MESNTTTSGSMSGMSGMPVESNVGQFLVLVGIALLASNILAISARCFSQIVVAKNFGINDVFMIMVNAIFALLVAFLVLGTKSGVGKHTNDVIASGVANISDSLKWVFFGEFFYVVLTTIMKMSLAISLWQWAITKWHKYILVAAIVIDVTIGSIVTTYTCLQCTPISFQWTRLDPATKGTCRDPKEIVTVGFALVGVTVVLDMLFLILPLFMLRDYAPPRKLKMYIYGVLFIGVLASLANFVRLGALEKLGTFKDPLFDAAPVFLWSMVEVSLGVFVAGILKLGPMMKRYGFDGFEYIGSSFDRMDEDEMPLKHMKGPLVTEQQA